MTRKLDVHFVCCEGEPVSLGESPFWDQGGHVWWVDITGRRLFRTELSSGSTRSWATPEMPGFVVLAGRDRPVVGMESGIFAFSSSDGIFELLVAFDRPGQRFNDATVDGRGRLWATTMALDARPGCAALHLVTDDLELRTVMEGLATPNGLAADLDGGRLFVSDSHPEVQTIWTADCDFSTGSLGARAPFADTRRLAGRPDGAALAADGSYWIAGVDGGALYGFSRRGLLEFVVPLPFAAPTKLAFLDGGLAVTAKREAGHEGRLAVATGVVPPLSGPAIPFWRAGGH